MSFTRQLGKWMRVKAETKIVLSSPDCVQGHLGWSHQPRNGPSRENAILQLPCPEGIFIICTKGQIIWQEVFPSALPRFLWFRILLTQ